MKADPIKEVTQLLRAWTRGEEGAKEELYQLVYDELRRLAHRYMSRENPGNTLQTTALVNDAYLKLADTKNLNWQNRAHFFAVSANIMRHILVDHARANRAERRGGDAQQVGLEDIIEIPQPLHKDVLALNDALDQLAKVDERKSQVVELRYFGGLSVEETAEVLKVSADTVMRDWRLAKAWLLRELSGDNSHEPATGIGKSTVA
ncbi:MAG TPA: sigma-70 family RNA polymerase sigma factor [Blastocatellia bacterium]|nr:sigma-70 family RNA polymerase sigma factor [Blastocatellia bacterium]HMV87483.1 sigma-70 family RNA polymerase sigma factor [Blastocatellia bacterium]HMY73077.1 sigma-70 family RNA polymerase sigma factor [Blastocatellia bacterium]HMZ22628.1 sigma-70 family RNA polymerase sigma factor [Blastocatellia bacterium]HNG33367.1 sigma-70 family RNA polymerase sigma factor [Blastocatellia bacterium]